MTASLRRVILIVAFLNLAYFGVEFGVALAIGSVSLFADSIDFLEDAALNLLVLAALGWPARSRGLLGMGLAGLVLVPGLATVWMAGEKFLNFVPPGALPLSVTGAGALAVNLACALLLVRYKTAQGSLTRAVYLSARNDVAANAAIIAAGFVTAATLSAWPDLAVGIAIGILNAGAAREIYLAAREERSAAVS